MSTNSNGSVILDMCKYSEGESDYNHDFTLLSNRVTQTGLCNTSPCRGESNIIYYQITGVSLVLN